MTVPTILVVIVACAVVLVFYVAGLILLYHQLHLAFRRVLMRRWDKRFPGEPYPWPPLSRKDAL